MRAELERLAAAVRRACPPAHRVTVLVVPNPTVAGPCGGVGFGCFIWPKRGPKVESAATIAVAAGMADVLTADYDADRSEGLHAVGETFLHELVHYEQWRSGASLTERGVKVRARNLYLRFTPGAYEPETEPCRGPRGGSA